MSDSTALPHVLSIPPYPPGRPISAVAREFGLDPAAIVKLASNENPMGAAPGALAAMRAAADEIALYPDFDCYALRQALAAALDQPFEHILPGAGSSDLILLAARGYLDAGRNAVLPQYSFAAYEGAIRAVGAAPVIVPARGWDADLDALLSAVDARTGVAFLATPNNPTGAMLSPADVEAFVSAVPGHVLVVLDEAYRDFLDEADRPRLARLFSLRENLLVLRTFSKIHGLAALRVGYGLANPGIIGVLKRLQMPFSVNAAAEAAAVAALADPVFADAYRHLNAVERDRMSGALAAAGFDTAPSHGNFLLVHVGDGGAMFQALMRRGVIVRPVTNYGLPAWVRVSIGLPAQNAAFLGHLSALKPHGSRAAQASL